MGVIVDANKDPSANDNWALVSGGSVVEIVVASLNFINNVVKNYDFLVDYTVGGQDPVDIGYTYNPQLDIFSPPPFDGVSQLQADLDGIHNSLLSTLADASQMTAQNIQKAISLATTDSSGSFSPNEQPLWNSITNFVAGGG